MILPWLIRTYSVYFGAMLLAVALGLYAPADLGGRPAADLTPIG